ncbi:MAG: hypothetical protein ACYTDT_13055 [Planctomycetota bacterium]|jgi:hypothetical protein
MDARKRLPDFQSFNGKLAHFAALMAGANTGFLVGFLIDSSVPILVASTLVGAVTGIGLFLVYRRHVRDSLDSSEKDWIREHSKLGLVQRLWAVEKGYLSSLTRQDRKTLNPEFVCFAILETGDTPASRLIELSGIELGWHGIVLDVNDISEDVDMDALMSSRFALDALLDAANVALIHEHSMVGTEHLLLHTLDQLLKADGRALSAHKSSVPELEHLHETVSDLIADEDYPWFKDGKAAAMDIDLIADTDPTPARVRMQNQRLYWSIMNG